MGNERRLKILEWAAILLGFCGVVILIIFLIIVRKSSYIIKYPIDLQVTSMIGTFISGTIGVLFSFVSVILFYSALIYQRKELHVANQSRKDLQEAYSKQNEFLEFQKFQDYYFQVYKFFSETKIELRTEIAINGVTKSSLFRCSFQGKLFVSYAETAIHVKDVLDIPDSSIFFAELDFEIIKRLFDYCQQFNSLITRSVEMAEKSDSNNRDYLYFQDTLISPLTIDEIFSITLYAFQEQQHTKLLLALSKSSVWLNTIKYYHDEKELNFLWNYTSQWFAQRPEYLSAVEDFRYN